MSSIDYMPYVTRSCISTIKVIIVQVTKCNTIQHWPWWTWLVVFASVWTEPILIDIRDELYTRTNNEAASGSKGQVHCCQKVYTNVTCQHKIEATSTAPCRRKATTSFLYSAEQYTKVTNITNPNCQQILDEILSNEWKHPISWTSSNLINYRSFVFINLLLCLKRSV